MVRRPRLVLPTLAVVALAALWVLAASFPMMPPNDPNYAPATCPPMSTCNGPTGQWNLFSFDAHFPPTLRPSGISANLAWQVTTGRPDTIIAVLDSGVQYDQEDLRNKIKYYLHHPDARWKMQKAAQDRLIRDGYPGSARLERVLDVYRELMCKEVYAG